MLTSTIRDARLDLGEVLTAEDIWDWRRERRAGFYAWSWLLVHRLLLGQEAGRDDLRDGMTRFLAGEADSLTDALGESAWSLQRDLERYADRRARRVVHPAAGGGTAADEYRCLDQRDIVRQLSLAVVHHNPELVERHVRNQLDEHPEDAELWTILSLAHESADDRDATLEAARHAVSLAPQDISANVRLASALAMGCILDVSAECRARWQEAVPLLRRALRQDPMRHDAVFTLGLAYLYSGRAGDSLNYLRIAHKRQPWAPHVNFYLGEAYRLVGDVRAREHLTRARQWSPTLLWRKLAEAGLKQLDSDDR